MRVAHFIHRYPPALGGSEAYFARLSRYLAGAGDRVTVFTTTALDLEAFWSARAASLPPGVATEQGVEVRRYSLWHWPGRRYLLKALSFFPHRLWQCLTQPCNPIAWAMWAEAGRGRVPFDVVHAAAFPNAWPIACGLRLARRLDVPFVLTPFLHAGDPDDAHDRTRRVFARPAFLHLARSADRVFVQTEIERRVFLDHGIPDDRLVLLGMGAEPAECTGGDRERARRQWGVQPGEAVVGHLANLSAEKGTVDLLRAAARARDHGTRFRLVLAGPEMPSFRRFGATCPSDGGVLRLGVLDDGQKRDFFAGLDLFALPSRADSFGLVFLEAWANGVPSVAYRAGGVAEVIRHEEDGLLVRCGDVEGLAATLGRLAGDADLRRRLGNRGRERIGREFRWPEKLAAVRAVYEDVRRARQNKPTSHRQASPSAPVKSR